MLPFFVLWFSLFHCLPFSTRELVSLLHARGVDVYLVSGGFYSVITPVAKELGIPFKNIFANRIKFFYDGKCNLSFVAQFLDAHL